ncbi:MGMT family protein [Enterococcus raffinosus]|uniref:MGMT family protein n=1 Tax=Enterococcus raffinosus TaxID=71452 RepID=A0AAW8T9P4_9ENTE|nr:MGMT family protein [Enterococcus raffinosus]MDT2521836.1 MGMT family protein [Enterococcus raffinosus]MDT2529145.1 MGMT family protein [Enterococcus raffinosus]MDT2532649.1 MGMT family protein [Enterococcus raffinosus]MDT2544484.1 MGMT family protein [Enterococcus raffinosus]MDT2556385.1 MGMT family protein [Enterococcus raffinosus]
MANEDKKDFNAMMNEDKGMPKMQIITDEAVIKRYGGTKMYFAPPLDYDALMKRIPYGKIITTGAIRDYLAKQNGGDFTEPITAGAFISIAAWASEQRETDLTPYWRTLKNKGEINSKYPGGVEAQIEKLEAEGHSIVRRGRKNFRYYVENYEEVMYEL